MHEVLNMNHGFKILISTCIILLNSICAYPQTTLVGEHDVLIPYKNFFMGLMHKKISSFLIIALVQKSEKI